MHFNHNQENLKWPVHYKKNIAGMKSKHGKYESSLGNKQHQPQIMVMNSIATPYAFFGGGRVGNYKNHHDWDAWLQIGQFESPAPNSVPPSCLPSLDISANITASLRSSFASVAGNVPNGEKARWELPGWLARTQLDAPVDSPHCILWFDYIQASTLLVSFLFLILPHYIINMCIYIYMYTKINYKGIFEPRTFHTNLYLQSPSKCQFYYPSAFCVWLLPDDVDHNFATTTENRGLYTTVWLLYTYQIYHSNIFKCKPSSYVSHLLGDHHHIFPIIKCKPLSLKTLDFFWGVNRFPKILLAWLQCPRSIHRQSWGTKAWWCHHRILRIDPRCNGNMAKVQDCWNVDGEASLLGCPWKLVTT